jgi:hypothetical protein
LFKSPRRPVILTEVLRGFSQFLHANSGQYYKLYHVRFLSNTFKFIIHLTHNVLSTLDNGVWDAQIIEKNTDNPNFILYSIHLPLL